MSELQNKITADLSDMAFRVPVVADLSAAQLEEKFRTGNNLINYGLQRQENDREAVSTDRRWAVFTELTRRAILEAPQVTNTISRFVDGKLGEHLPANFVAAVKPTDSAVSRGVARGGSKLEEYLGLPEVPDALMTHGISTTPTLRSRESLAEDIEQQAQRFPAQYEQILHEVKAAASGEGISNAEKELVARRYRYARDAKLLGLLADINRNPLAFTENHGSYEATTDGGAYVILSKEAFELNPDLYDPRLWESRRQIKDRVYEVMIAGKSYIMKEQKTARHTDTLQDGHVPGRTSVQEFLIGQEMSSGGVTSLDGMEFEWEKPLGAVEFPDGYQFCLFEKVQNALDYKISSIEKIAEEISRRPEAYATEFTKALARARELASERPDLFGDTSVADFSFDDFAHAKADALITLGERNIEKIILRNGYTDSDHKGFMIVLFPPADSRDKPVVKLVGMDYEYFEKDPEKSKKRLDIMTGDELSGLCMPNSCNLVGEDNEGQQMSARDVLEYALLCQAGWELPKATNHGSVGI